jgi:hypothetical protein
MKRNAAGLSVQVDRRPYKYATAPKTAARSPPAGTTIPLAAPLTDPVAVGPLPPVVAVAPDEPVVFAAEPVGLGPPPLQSDLNTLSTSEAHVEVGHTVL